MGTFGNEAVGSTYDYENADRKQGQMFTLTENGSVTKLSVYVSNNAEFNQECHVKGIIYSDNPAGTPDALKGTTPAITIAAGRAAGWLDCTFAAPVALTAGVYWIGIIWETDTTKLRWYRELAGGTLAHNANDYTAGPSDPFGAHTDSTSLFSIHADYDVPVPGFVGMTVTRLLQG